MSANPTPAIATVSTYSVAELVGLMTVSVILALLVIGLVIRIFKTYKAVRQYEEVCEKFKEIEQQLEEMTRAHARECFDLEQIIYDRNNELIDLKNKLLKFNLNGPV